MSSGKRKRPSADDYFSPPPPNHLLQRGSSEAGSMRSYDRFDNSPAADSRPRNHSPNFSRARDDPYAGRSADRKYSGGSRYDSRDRRRSDSPERRPRITPRSPEPSYNTRSYQPRYSDRGSIVQSRDRSDTKDSPRRPSTYDDHSSSATPQPQSVGGLGSDLPASLNTHSHPTDHEGRTSFQTEADTMNTPNVAAANTRGGGTSSNSLITALADVLADLTKQTTKQVIYTLERESARRKLDECKLEKEKSESFFSSYPNVAEQKKAGLAQAEKDYQSINQKLVNIETEMVKAATVFATKVVTSNIGSVSSVGAIEPLRTKYSQLEKAFHELKAENDEQKRELLSFKEDSKKLREASDAHTINIQTLQDKTSTDVPGRLDSVEQSLKQVNFLVDGPQSVLQQFNSLSEKHDRSVENLKTSIEGIKSNQDTIVNSTGVANSDLKPLRSISEKHNQDMEIIQNSMKEHQTRYDELVITTNSACSDLKKSLEPLKYIPTELGQAKEDIAKANETIQQQATELSKYVQNAARQDDRIELLCTDLAQLSHTTTGENENSLQNLVSISMDNERRHHDKFEEIQKSISSMRTQLESLMQQLLSLEKVDIRANPEYASEGAQADVNKHPISSPLDYKVASLEKQLRFLVSDADTEKDAFAAQIQSIRASLAALENKSRAGGDSTHLSAELHKLTQKYDEMSRGRESDMNIIVENIENQATRIESFESSLHEIKTARAKETEQVSAEEAKQMSNLIKRVEAELYDPANTNGLQAHISRLKGEVDSLWVSYSSLDERTNNINTRDMATHILSQVNPNMHNMETRFNQLSRGLEELQSQLKAMKDSGPPVGGHKSSYQQPMPETTITPNSLREQSRGPSRTEMDDYSKQLVMIWRHIREIRRELGLVKEGSSSSKRTLPNLNETTITRSGLSSRQPSLQRSGSESSARRVMSATPNYGFTRKKSSNHATEIQDEESHPDVFVGDDFD
ncbi:hypothetical protein PVAG01_07725 [Phlyctema vagabunda]|uniref:Uncharacterized protein n=1 Tax=Phlyctema vagabunda TaxID=108571 RepID=A0ABR4PDD2_9HELO